VGCFDLLGRFFGAALRTGNAYSGPLGVLFCFGELLGDLVSLVLRLGVVGAPSQPLVLKLSRALASGACGSQPNTMLRNERPEELERDAPRSRRGAGEFETVHAWVASSAIPWILGVRVRFGAVRTSPQ
jgi:hypothetical protein